MTARIAGPTETDGESDCLIEGVPEAYVANQAYTIRVGCSVFRGGRGCALLFHASGGTFAGQGDAGSTATCLTSNSRFDTLLERQWTAPSEDEAGDVSFRALCGHFTQAVRSEDFASSWGGEVYTAPPTDAPVTTDAPTTDAPTTDAPVNATECDCGFVNDADVAQGCAECPPAVTEPLKATFIGKAIDLTEFACKCGRNNPIDIHGRTRVHLHIYIYIYVVIVAWYRNEELSKKNPYLHLCTSSARLR